MADGSRVSPDGEVVISLLIGDEEFLITCLVLRDFPYELLFGLKFMISAPVDIISSEDKIVIGINRTEFRLSRSIRPNEAPVFLSETVAIPAYTEAAARISIPDQMLGTILIEGNLSHIGVLVTPTLSRPFDLNGTMTAYCCLINHSPNTLHIAENTQIGTAIPINDAQCLTIGEEDEDDIRDEIRPPVIAEQIDIKQLNFDDNISPENRAMFETMLQRVGLDLFSVHAYDLGHTDLVKHHIDTGDSRPIRCAPYRKSFQERKRIHDMVQEFKKNGLVRDSQSDWAAPVVLVPKKDGSKRFCCDWRKLNAVTKKDSMPIPRVDDTLDRLSGSAWFTTADFTCGYYQVDMAEDSIEKTAFITPDGLYEWTQLGMGLCNAPATFMRLMYQVLGPLMWTNAMAYLDDVVIFSKTFEDHVQHVEAVFTAIKKAGLKLKPKKCSFAKTRIEYLGHIVSKEGILPHPNKLKDIAEFPAPKCVKQVQQFLGLAGYYRRFKKDFAATARPLTQLLNKGAPWIWGTNEQNAFEELREALITPPILAHPDMEKPFIVSTDASSFATGGVLKQLGDDGLIHVIAYTSRNMNSAQRNYSATERECLAVIHAVDKFRPYLYGNKFTIVTDHCALCWLMTVKNPNGRLVRWSLALQDFEFEIEYESGRKHLDADALSRIAEDLAPEVEEKPLLALSIGDGDARIRDLQREEAWLQPILQHLTDPSTPVGRGVERRARAFELKNGLLLRRVMTTEGQKLVPVVPKKMRAEILESLHDHVTAGHLGVSKTWKRIRSRFYWPKMYHDVAHYVLSCKVCGATKICHQAPPGLLQPIPPTTKPFERVAIDKLGPFLTSIDGNVHILVLTDYATRMAFARAVPNGTAEEAAKFLVEEIFLRHGAPKEILTDRGREFMNRLFAAVTATFGTKHQTTTAYHPRTNGLCERFNGTLAKMIAAYTKDHRDWDRFLPHLLFAYNTSVHDVTGYSPYFLLHGIEPTLEVQRRLAGNGAVDEQFTFENIMYAIKAREIAASHTIRSQEQAKERFDKHRREQTYTPGNLVWIRRIHRVLGKTEKLLPAYLGPFKIIAQTAANDYQVEDAAGKTDVVNVERLKPYLQRDESFCSPTTNRDSHPAPGVVENEHPGDSDDQIIEAWEMPDASMLMPQLENTENQEVDRLSNGDTEILSNDESENQVASSSSQPAESLGYQTRYGRVSRPPAWIQRCAPSTL